MCFNQPQNAIFSMLYKYNDIQLKNGPIKNTVKITVYEQVSERGNVTILIIAINRITIPFLKLPHSTSKK